MYSEPFTTVWIEFETVGQARRYYVATPYPARLSPQCQESVDILCEGQCVPTGQLYRLPGVVKRPQIFVLDPEDPLLFLAHHERFPALAA